MDSEICDDIVESVTKKKKVSPDNSDRVSLFCETLKFLFFGPITVWVIDYKVSTDMVLHDSEVFIKDIHFSSLTPFHRIVETWSS